MTRTRAYTADQQLDSSSSNEVTPAPSYDEDDILLHGNNSTEVPVTKQRFFGMPPICLCILVVEFCERFAFYGASLLFSLYMMQMLDMNIATTNAYINAFNFWAYFSSLIGGWVSDNLMNKFQCILMFGISYSVGLVSLTVSSLPFTFKDFPYGPDVYTIVFFLSSLFFIGLGMGGIKANVSVLCADQLPKASDLQIQRLFRWFYWSINAGALLGQGISPFLHHMGPTKIIIDEEGNRTFVKSSYYFSYGVTAIVFFLGIFIFICGRKFYIDNRCETSRGLLYYLKVIFKAFMKKKENNEINFIDRCSDDYSPSTLYETKAVFRALSVFSVFPVFWLLYNQLQSSFIAQGLWMKRPDWLTADQLNLVDSIALIVLIPLMDSLVFPFLKKRGFNLGPIKRISIGFFIASMAFVYTGVLQFYIAKKGHWDSRENYIVNKHETAISVWLQVPPYVMIAISEIFTCVTALEFAYTQAPRPVKSSIMAIYLLTSALGSALGLLCTPWFIPQNMVWIYFSFSGAMFVMIFPFFGGFRHYDAESKKKQQGYREIQERESSANFNGNTEYRDTSTTNENNNNNSNHNSSSSSSRSQKKKKISADLVSDADDDRFFYGSV